MKRHVLLVDDEPGILLTLGAILEMNEFVVETASCAREAQEVLRAATFDAIITDLKMETERSGFEIAAFASTRRPRPVTIVLSAFPKLAVDWKQQGVDAFFEKPVPTVELLRAIDGLFARHDAAATT